MDFTVVHPAHKGGPRGRSLTLRSCSASLRNAVRLRRNPQIERAAVNGQLSVKTNSSFGKLIARLSRQEAGLTRKELGSNLGVLETFTMLVEQGRRRMTLDRVPLLARIPDVDPQAMTRQALAEEHPIAYAVIFQHEVEFQVSGSAPPPRAPQQRALRELEEDFSQTQTEDRDRIGIVNPLSSCRHAFDRKLGYAGTRHPGVEGMVDGNLAQIKRVQAADRPAGGPASHLGGEDDVSLFGGVGDPHLRVA
jgi:hypothetical protein